jgi:hypothetical protein
MEEPLGTEDAVCHSPRLLEEVLQLLPFDTRRKISDKDLAMSCLGHLKDSKRI